MIEKPFDSIEKRDIDALIEIKKAERRALEYKADLPMGLDDPKREFLADIASFANSAGGDILYGVTDERDENNQPTGIPKDASGLIGVNETSEQLRLESIIRDGIAPRIAGVQIKSIPGFARGPVILVRIPRSWAAPHMVTFKNLSRFYARNSAGKYQLDIGEIRSAFALSESLPEKIRAFRAERLAKIISGETPVPFAPNCAVVLHLFPLTAVEGSRSDVSREAGRLVMKIAPLMSQNWGNRFNADGFLTYDDREWGLKKRRASTYVQIFRSGALEIANQRMLIRQIPEYDEVIPMNALEKELIEAVARFVGFQREIGITPPIVLMLSLIGVKNFAITISSNQWTDSKIDRDVLMAPDLLIEDFEFQPDVLLRPSLDFIWQAAGLPDSPNYGQDGRWVER
jgi:Putative DNA-binding domain